MRLAGDKLTYVVAAVTAVLLTLAFAAPFGTANQATYLLDPLHRAQPELYSRDWFVSETPSYMPVFGWLAQWLFRIDPDGPTAVLAAHVVVTLATYAALYWLISAVCTDRRAFVIIAAFVTISKGAAMGASYLLAGYLQPSSLATLGWVYAIAALVRGRYLACGLAAACAGAVHANFLVLGVGLFTLTALACRATRVELVKLLAPQLVVLAWFIPQLVGATGPSEDALRILTEFHSPMHYSPSRLVAAIPTLLAWQLAAFAALRLGEDWPREMRALWWFSLISFAVVTASALVVRYTPLHALTQVFWARIAPFGQVACQIVVVAALVRHARTAPSLARARRALIGLAIVGALLASARYLRYLVPVHALPIAAAFVVVALLPVARVGRWAVTALAVLALAGALWAGPRGRGLTTVPYGSAFEGGVTSWAREHTPRDAAFLMPPEFGRFRLLARRAVVADTKSPPLRPDLLVAWYRRLCAMVLVPEAANVRVIEARYAQLTDAELAAVARQFDVDYVVVWAARPLPWERAFGDAYYAAYRVPR